MIIDLFKKSVVAVSHGGFFAHIQYYSIKPFPQKIQQKKVLIKNQAYLSPKDITLKTIIKSIEDKNTIIELVCSKRIGLSNTLTLIPNKDFWKPNIKILQVQYPHRIKAEPLEHFNGAIVFHTTSNRNNVADIAYENIVLRGWSAIGYHFVILQDGTIINTRPIMLRGDHTYGYNDSIGIGFARNLTKEPLSTEEINAVDTLVANLKRYFHITKVFGHRTAQLEAIKNTLSRCQSKNPNYAQQIKPHIDKITLIQATIHQDQRITSADIKADLDELILFLRNSPEDLQKQYFIGDRPLINYIKEIKECPGKYFTFSLFPRLK